MPEWSKANHFVASGYQADSLKVLASIHLLPLDPLPAPSTRTPVPLWLGSTAPTGGPVVMVLVTGTAVVTQGFTCVTWCLPRRSPTPPHS